MVHHNSLRAGLLALLMSGIVAEAWAQSDETCADALVVSTYSRIDTENTDFRLAWHVSESAYEDVRKNAGANATIYGIPMGANYSDFKINVRERTANYKSEFTQAQATNVMWTGLDPNSESAYTECIKSKKFSRSGLHLAVKSATRNEVTVWVGWSPRGPQAIARPEWFWDSVGSDRLPKRLVAGERTIVLPRPSQQQTLSVNFEGYTDSLIVEPFPPPVEIQPVEYMEELKEYEGDVVVGWGINFSQPYTLCTPEMPAGWTIVRVRLRLESDTQRGSCGSWTTCGGQETDTPTRACRTVTVQGHNDGKYDGYGRAKPVLSVVWRRPK